VQNPKPRHFKPFEFFNHTRSAANASHDLKYSAACAPPPFRFWLFHTEGRGSTENRNNPRLSQPSDCLEHT